MDVTGYRRKNKCKNYIDLELHGTTLIVFLWFYKLQSRIKKYYYTSLYDQTMYHLDSNNRTLCKHNEITDWRHGISGYYEC